MQLHRDEFSVEQMMAYLFEKIVSSRGTVDIEPDVLPEMTSRRGHHHRISGTAGIDAAARHLLKTGKSFRRNNGSSESGL